jgi:hypothetical protein
LKSVTAGVACEPEHGITAEAEPSQEDLVRAAIVLGDDFVHYRVELRCVSLVPSAYISTLRANHYERGGQSGTDLRVRGRRSMRGDTIRVIRRQRLPPAM